jgi:hypothetical protein
MTKAELKARLRTPHGQLQLLAALFATALVLALVVALNRPFFERYVREKYPEPPSLIEDLVTRIETGEAGPEEVTKLGREERVQLYHAWQLGPDDPAPDARLPRVLFQADAQLYAELVERTLAAGTPPQRLRAAVLAAASGHEDARAVLEWGLERARRQGDAALAEALGELLDGSDGLAPVTSSG